MKSMESLYKEILSNESLRQALTNAGKAGRMEKFLKDKN